MSEWEDYRTRARWRRALFPAYVAQESGHWLGGRVDVGRDVPKFDVSGLRFQAAHTRFETLKLLSVPFDEWWMEAAPTDDDVPWSQYAAHFRAVERLPGEPVGAWVARLPEAARRCMREEPRARLTLPQCRWVVRERQVSFWRSDATGRAVVCRFYAAVFGLDDEGAWRVVTGYTEDAVVPDLVDLSAALGESYPESELQRALDTVDRRRASGGSGRTADVLDLLATPGVFALALMHCSNVTTYGVGRNRRREIAPDALAEDAGLRYAMLEVSPMRAAADGADGGAGEDDGPLHVVRGHFKDYREKGLFGRVRGIFYWEPHVRGNPERGATEKDYSVTDGQADGDVPRETSSRPGG